MLNAPAAKVSPATNRHAALGLVSSPLFSERSVLRSPLLNVFSTGL